MNTKTTSRRTPRMAFGALLLAMLAGCGNSVNEFDDGPRNIVWREIIISNLGGPGYRDYPRIGELSLDEAAVVLGDCVSVRPSCGDALLELHPGLRGNLLRFAWPRRLASMDPRFVPRLLARGAVADGDAIDHAMQRQRQQGKERLLVMRALLDAGAAVDAVDSDGRTALHRAAREGDTEMVRLLLRFGADPERLDRNGLDAATLAQAQGGDEIVRLLRAAALPASGGRGTSEVPAHP